MFFQTAEWENTNQRGRIEGLGLSKAKPGLPDVSGPRPPHRRGSRVHVEKAPDWQIKGHATELSEGPGEAKRGAGWTGGDWMGPEGFNRTHSLLLTVSTCLPAQYERLPKQRVCAQMSPRSTQGAALDCGPKGKADTDPRERWREVKSQVQQGRKDMSRNTSVTRWDTTRERFTAVRGLGKTRQTPHILS